MSVEALTVAAIVEKGVAGLRKAYQAGISSEDFPTYEEEFQWIEGRLSTKQSINARIFRKKFTDFDWLVARESLDDLFAELKAERAFMDLDTLLKSVQDDLEVDNAIEKAEFLRDSLAGVTRLHAPISDVPLVGGWREHIAQGKALRRLSKAGQPPGIPTGLKWLDHHWDGLVRGRMIVTLGRPGEGKTFLINKIMWHAVKTMHTIMLVSPELSDFEHRCRMHTLASADPDVKEAFGLKRAYRNRALMNGVGYNMKTYAKFCEFIDDEFGEVILLSNLYRRQRMTPGYVESRVADIAPDLLIVDPIYELHAPRRRDSPIHEISDISHEIEHIAQAYNIPVLVTNQAHRQGAGRDDAPHKDKSFNSDVPVQEADHVIGVKYVSEEHRLLLRCSKSRFGEEFRFECEFYPNIGLMKETSDPRGNYYNGSDDPEQDELERIVNEATREEGVPHGEG